ncbi:MAG TPA: hypothetical protein PKY87_02205 [Terricaulis sp.]|nr:hypothetical protein [Terricaulis sp.]
MTGLFDSLPAHVAIPEQIACVKREIAMRERCYPRWISKGTMTPGKADAELAGMRAVLKTLEGLRNA